LQGRTNLNLPSKVQAGQLLGRCHAALGQHALSVAALDAALQLTKAAELLFTEALVVRDRALLGKVGAAGSGVGNGSGSGLHWDEHTGKQQLEEVMGRMQGSNNRAMLEKLLVI
jgi:hypothetical protein